ncbi:PREDICTED: uncharacterized protein C6orf203 [Nicrophorus vespilloides]|uniref:Uncharacterized protein C6orf203 n=1 Tax=Nicrophorus vespilloides TaxID=110193 RepID=A0ABM1MYE5_NICVS|nr:PREDICTED: uncharacterized protein C6orf203 [Nicrophorus vespilloides]
MFNLARQRLIRAVIREVRKPTVKNIRCLNTITQLPLTTTQQTSLTPCRYKSNKSKGKSKQQSESEDEPDEQDFDDELNDKSTKLMNLKVTSMRLDGILKSGLGISRSKVEVMFYESKIRLNGEKVLKKGATVQEGDEIDIVKGVNTDNPKFLTVGRVEVLNAANKEDHISLKVRRYKTLTIENYADPWKGS